VNILLKYIFGLYVYNLAFNIEFTNICFISEILLKSTCTNQHLLLYNANPSLIFSEVTEVSKLENNKDHFSITTENMGVNKVIDFLNR